MQAVATDYEILGVSPEAEPEVIQAAYRALMKKYHPDAGDPSSDARAKQITAAYATLSDPCRRSAYDLDMGLGAKRQEPPPESEPEARCPRCESSYVTLEVVKRSADDVRALAAGLFALFVGMVLAAAVMIAGAFIVPAHMFASVVGPVGIFALFLPIAWFFRWYYRRRTLIRNESSQVFPPRRFNWLCHSCGKVGSTDEFVHHS